MSSLVILEFDPSVGKSQYSAVNKVLGVDPQTGEGNWPDGMLTHAAGIDADGTFRVIELWESEAQQETFMHSRLGAALAEGGVTKPPTSVTWMNVIGHAEPGI